MKDIYFSDKDKTGEIPILTQEEIELIKQHRRQKAGNSNSFITPPSERTASKFDVDFEYDPLKGLPNPLAERLFRFSSTMKMTSTTRNL